MLKRHTVEQGEHLSGILLKYGFVDPAPIWNHADNSELREVRRHPHVLAPGDRIAIPVRKNKSEQCSTEQKHRFQYHAKPLILRLTLLDLLGEPMSNTPCTLNIEFDQFKLMTNGGGQIEQIISKIARNAILTIQDVEIPLAIGSLDPIDLSSGQQARLNNLGYYSGKPNDKPEEDSDFNSAVEEFQCDQEITVDGACGPVTQAKLQEVHGY